MPYKLILSELIDEKTRDIGENVFFDNLPCNYPVYVFYYPGAMPNEDLEGKLRNLGNMTGKNLFVNIGRLDDPNYGKIANKFNIKNLPVIIITAINKLSSPPTKFLTAYARIDSKGIINTTDLVIQCLQKLFNLFIQEKISEAMSQAKQDERDALISRLKGIVADALKGIWGFLKDRDISVSLVEGKFELKHSGS